MKQRRKMKSPFFVTSGLVDDGEIIGTLFAWQIGAAAREADDATSPSTATTFCCEISLVTAFAASSCFDWSSSVSTLILRPLMPPAAFTSSMAIMMPLCVDWPNVACGPVSEPYSPTRISPPPAAVLVVLVCSPLGGQPARSTRD